MKIRFSKKYGNKSKSIIRLALAIKGLSGSLAGYAYIVEQDPKLALWIFLSGAVANEIVNFLKDESNEISTKPKNNTDDYSAN